MINVTQVREYAQLTTDETVTTSLDLAIVKPETFDWLVSLSEQQGSGRFISFERPRYLKLHSYVGYLQSPCGEGIEVLPKTSLGTQDSAASRKILRNMLCSALHISHKEAQSAQLNRMNMPIHEWIYNQFLQHLSKLVASGLKFDYLRIEEESKFIRGQLDVVAQQRQHVGRAHLFHIRHDVYHPNRLENRLIKSALNYVKQSCHNHENWRLANELSHIIAPVSSINLPLRQMSKWENTKTLQHYQPIKPWCQLILEQMNPNFQKGGHRGITLLFAMERLFEEHVASCLKKLVKPPWQLKTQASSKFMAEDNIENKKRFYLKPDLLINKQNKHHHILDTKWKLIDSSNSKDNFNIDQSDIYQLFAYGHKYLCGIGDMMLIYPKYTQFEKPILYFQLDKNLKLWIVPFCIANNQLVEGDWRDKFTSLL